MHNLGPKGRNGTIRARGTENRTEAGRGARSGTKRAGGCEEGSGPERGGQHWRVGEGTAVTGARGGRGGEGTVVTGARGDDDILLGGRVGRGQRGERWILLGVDGQRSRIPQQIPDSEC